RLALAVLVDDALLKQLWRSASEKIRPLAREVAHVFLAAVYRKVGPHWKRWWLQPKAGQPNILSPHNVRHEPQRARRRGAYRAKRGQDFKVRPFVVARQLA